MPYTYLINHVPSGRVYYGVRFAEGCDPKELGDTYFSSSKYVKELLVRDGVGSFDFEVRKIFDDVSSAREWENKVLRRMAVVNDDRFLNKTDNKSIDPMLSKSMLGKNGPEHSRYGSKNEVLAEYNKKNPRKGELNGMYGRRGHLHPMYGKRGELSPHYGKERHDLSVVVTCPHCEKIGKVGGMQRWHFDRCKER